ncbi:D-serine ammonia-lyase [Virgibacillus siamensis]|uniref:D-serine ammonia-lyase n=1 Tax=Virgibacillus siamensis TaxID=480071 RepID=UPI0009877504|nr:D-serine ammonia-lyase [Virgibacillus siamensis]
MVFSQQELANWIEKYPPLKQITEMNPAYWSNPHLHKQSGMDSLPITKQDMLEAKALWERFAPYLRKVFPESDGIIESPLKQITNFQKNLMPDLEGKLYLKCDNDLPIVGSIKARGGLYEILHYAERLAIDAGMVSTDDNYEIFASDQFKTFFSQYAIGVGSTGNLGLSIGTISAKLGFNVSVYMSADAKQWKKDLLRSRGAAVHEFSGDFSEAILQGREQTIRDPKAYFVDDEDSKHLFLGYSVAAFELQKQLGERDIEVNAEHPLFVYLPCGVGGSPGGITFGLKHVFGEHVHCFFVEPTHSPSVLIGLLTGGMEKFSVQDFGIDNITEADGLAVGRPSAFATAISDSLISGIFTVEDPDLYRYLTKLADTEGIYLEPSATAGLIGPERVKEYVHRLPSENITHIAWATGGSLVPGEDMKEFYAKGKRFLEKG